MAVAETQGKGKAHKNRTKEGPRTEVRTSGGTALLPKLNLHRTRPGGRKKT